MDVWVGFIWVIKLYTLFRLQAPKTMPSVVSWGLVIPGAVMSTVTNPCPQIFKLMHHPSFSPHFYPCCDFHHHHSHKHGSSYSRPFCFTFHLISSQYSPLFSTSSVAELALSLIVTGDRIFVYTNCLN